MLSSLDFTDKKVLITGATGFVGSWLSIWLKKLGAKIYGISSNENSKSLLLNSIPVSDVMQFHNCDVRSYEKLKDIVCSIKPDYIFHIAARSLSREAFHSPYDTFDVNIVGTINILETLRTSDCPCTFIYFSSDRCYMPQKGYVSYKETDSLGGIDPYSASKSCGEYVFNSYSKSYFERDPVNIRLSTVRLNNIIGGGDWSKGRIVPDVMEAWKQNSPLYIQNPNNVIPWQYILDPLYGVLSLASLLKKEGVSNGQVFNFGSDDSLQISINDLVKKFVSYLPPPNKIEYMYDKSSDHVPSTSLIMSLDCNKARKVLNWKPITSMDKAIELTVDWYNSYFNENGNMLDFTLKQIDLYENKLREHFSKESLTTK